MIRRSAISQRTCNVPNQYRISSNIGFRSYFHDRAFEEMNRYSDGSYGSCSSNDDMIKMLEISNNKDINKEVLRVEKLLNNDPGYDGDREDKLNIKEELFFVNAFIKRIKSLTVRGMFEAVFSLRTTNSHYYEILLKKNNRELVLQRLIAENDNILKIEICAAFGYAEELQNFLANMHEGSIKLFLGAKYLEDDKTIIEYAEEFEMDDIFAFNHDE